MSLNTYTNLKAAVEDWINKTSISASADDFITLAEAYFNQELRTRQMEVLATGTITTNPIDLLTELTRWASIKSVSINVGGGDVVLSQIPQDLRMARFSLAPLGIPEYYTVIGDAMYFDPSPDGDYDYTILYKQRIEPLSITNDSNWLLASHPNLYLYAALSEAAIFAKDNEAAQAYVALRDRYLSAVRRADLRDRSGGSSRMISELRAV
jgi:hypothetical protein